MAHQQEAGRPAVSLALTPAGSFAQGSQRSVRGRLELGAPSRRFALGKPGMGANGLQPHGG